MLKDILGFIIIVGWWEGEGGGGRGGGGALSAHALLQHRIHVVHLVFRCKHLLLQATELRTHAQSGCRASRAVFYAAQHLLADHVALSLEERVALLRRLLGKVPAKTQRVQGLQIW
jgi:hypothetical protein